MKKHVWIYFIVLVIILIVVFWHRIQSTNFNVVESKELPSVDLPVTNAVFSNQSSTNPIPKTVPPKNLGSYAAYDTNVLPAIQREIDSRNVPIEFYGQFIDQDSNAIPDVNIKVAVVHLTMPDSAMTDL